MQVHLKNLTTLDASRVKYFDQQEEIGFASIVEMDETVALDLNGAVMRSWPKGDQPEVWWIKSVDADRVVLDLHRPQVAIISAESFEWRELGYLNELYLSIAHLPTIVFALPFGRQSGDHRRRQVRRILGLSTAAKASWNLPRCRASRAPGTSASLAVRRARRRRSVTPVKHVDAATVGRQRADCTSAARKIPLLLPVRFPIAFFGKQ